MYELQYIRTDRNGTKIFHDCNCPRCGGAGRSDNWWRTGFVCHACGGTGKRNTPKVIKEYTPEYAAKLEAKRMAKSSPESNEEELVEKANETKRNTWKEQGFSVEGVGYIISGDTYKHKDVIRKAGGKWCNYIRAWISPLAIENLAGTKVTVVKAEDLCNEYNRIDPEKAWDLQI